MLQTDVAQRTDASGLVVIVLGLRRLAFEGVELLLDLGCRIPLLFTVPHDITGEPGPDSFAALAERAKATLFVTDRVNTPEFESLFSGLRPDLILTLGWRRLLGRRLLATSRLGGVNVHMAPLPRFRGFAPQNWVIISGSQTGGVTLHHMAHRFDVGDIIDQRTYPVGARETIADLDQKGLAGALEMLRTRIPEIAMGTAPRRIQNEGEASYCFPRRPSDGEIDWKQPALEIDRLVRAVTHPYPGAFTHEGLRKLFIWSARPHDDSRTILAVPGSILAYQRGGGVLVATGQGVLELLRVQPLNGIEMEAGDHIRSIRARLGLNATEALTAARS